MPTTLTATQVAALNILKTELQTKHKDSLQKVDRAIAIAEEISILETNLASKQAKLADIDAEVAAASADFANFFLEKAGL